MERGASNVGSACLPHAHSEDQKVGSRSRKTVPPVSYGVYGRPIKGKGWILTSIGSKSRSKSSA